MRIGEVARRLGAGPPTIRYYEEVGVLPAPTRGDNRYREYTDVDLRRLELVLALRRLNVPIGEIKSLAGSCFDHRCATGTQQLLEVIDRRSAQVYRQIDELGSLADRFAHLRRRLTRGGDSTMAIDVGPGEQTTQQHGPRAAACDCGCAGSGCACGCACCGVAEHAAHAAHAAHAEHQNAIEVLAQAPQSACDCGCCG